MNKYKCIRKNKEICNITTEFFYNIGDIIEIMLQDNTIVETVSILEIVE